MVIAIIALLISLLLPALGKARTAAQAATCLSNQKQTTLALINYTTEHKNRLMHYAIDQPDGSGRQWWFGFQQGQSTNANRPLDKSRGPLADYLGGDIQDGLACPAFPEDDPGFVAKFDQRSAHFGYNGAIVWPFPVGRTPRRIDEFDQPSHAFAFVDAVHQDFSNTRFYEPHTAAYRRPGKVAGTGHFRHAKQANIALLDGHAQPIPPPQNETVWATFGSADVINVDTADGPKTRYGFKTWTQR